MRCLVVGGTGFLGGAITDALVQRGHTVSVLSRGIKSRQTQSGFQVLAGDRYGSLEALRGQEFDWVFDSCAYVPDAVRSLLNAVGHGITRYCMISSISAYGSFAKPDLDESEAVQTATEQDYAVAGGLSAEMRTSAFAYGASYGLLKRACEIEAERLLGERSTSLRVGLLVGAGDYTDRLTWWVRRIDGATERFAAPAPPFRSVQLIDVRDVARFALRCADEDLAGLWNVTGQVQSFKDVLSSIVSVTGSKARAEWVSEEAILDAELTPWVDIPMMAPSSPDFRYFMDVSTAKARAAGLECRAFEETLGPLIDWDRTRRHLSLKCGMSAEQEARLLERASRDLIKTENT